MARFNEPHDDYRGSEYDRRYGRFEQAYARRFARERYRMERQHRLGRAPHWTPRPPDKEFLYEDRAYSRRHWPPAMRDRYRNY